jgi:crotonobetainyl-CoA:carnitine CoA-transferase CaiB-like acyl-CoA transferase
MDKIFISKTSSEWMRILKEGGDIVCSLVQNISDLENDPQVFANKYIIECNYEALD